MALKIRIIGGNATTLAAAITAHDTAMATLVAAAAPQEVAPRGTGLAIVIAGPDFCVTTNVQFQG